MDNNSTIKFNWRAFFSVLSALSFLGMVFTGIILFVVPPGRIANWTGWTLLGLTKHQWIGLHDWFSIIFIAASVFHIYLNWKPLVSYFKNKVSKAFALRIEWTVALVICGIAFVGTVGEIKPFSALLAWNENIKHSWDETQERAPIPHAELLTLTELSEQVHDVSLETMLSNLKSKGIEVESPDIVLGDLAEAHNRTPVQIYNIAVGQAGAGKGQGGHGQREGGHGGSGPGRGFGQMTLKDYCDNAGLNLEKALQQLKGADFKASSEMTIRSIADTTGAHPSEIRTLLEPRIQ